MPTFAPLEAQSLNLSRLFEAADVLALGMAVLVLRSIYTTHRTTYLAEHDTMEVKPLAVPCVALAFLVRGSLDRSPFFDMMWAIAVNLDTVAALPQLWMLVLLAAHFLILAFPRGGGAGR